MKFSINIRRRLIKRYQHNEQKDMECHDVRVKLDNVNCIQI